MTLDPALPPSLAAELADLKRRLANLERSPSLPFSSFRGGALVFHDDDGNVRWAMGNVNLDGTVVDQEGSGGGATSAYGVFGYGDGGAIVLAQRELDRGLIYPATPFPMHDAAFKTVTSSTFVNLWEGRISLPAHEVLYVRGATETQASTVGELRLTEIVSQTHSSALTIPAGSGGGANYNFRWLHPSTTGLYDDRAGRAVTLFVALEGRRVSGANSFFVFPPTIAELTSKFLHPTAATNGAPTYDPP